MGRGYEEYQDNAGGKRRGEITLAVGLRIWIGMRSAKAFRSMRDDGRFFLG